MQLPVRKIWVCVAVFSLSLGIRALYVGLELRGHSTAQIIAFNWDSREYVHLGHNLASAGTYVDWTNPDAQSLRISHFFAMLRTPGYPLFLAIFERFSGSIDTALWAQVILGSLIPVAVLLVGREIFGQSKAPIAAAIVSAFSSTGIGSCGMFLVDLLFGLCVIAAWWMLMNGVGRQKFAWYAGCGVMLGLGVLVKPGLLYWPLAMPVVAWLMGIALNRKVCARHLALAAVFPWVIVAAWCLRNFFFQGGWAYCIVDGQNLRQFVTPLVEERDKVGAEPTFDAVMQNQNTARQRDWDDMANGQVTAVQLGRRQRMESLRIIAKHPWLTIQSIYSCAWDNWASGWPYTRDQLSNVRFLKRAVMGIDAGWYLFGRRIGIPLILLALLDPIFSGQGLRDAHRKKRFFGLLALLVTFGYFWVLCGTSFSVGFRTLYPAEFTLLLMMAAGVEAGVRLFVQTPAGQLPVDMKPSAWHGVPDVRKTVSHCRVVCIYCLMKLLIQPRALPRWTAKHYNLSHTRGIESASGHLEGVSW